MQNYLAEKNLVIYFQICTYHLPDQSRYEVEATLKQRRDKVVSELFERCFIVGHLRCINVGKRWKSDIPTGTPRRIHIDSTSILRQYVKDQILTNFHVISTYFFRRNFTGRKIHVVSSYSFHYNFTGRKIHVGSSMECISMFLFIFFDIFGS